MSINVVRNETRRNVHARSCRDEQIVCSGNDHISFAGKPAKSASMMPGSHDGLPRISEQTDQLRKEFPGHFTRCKRIAWFEPTDGDQDFMPSAKVVARPQIDIVGHSASSNLNTRSISSHFSPGLACGNNC